jgi:hypothetical protein
MSRHQLRRLTSRTDNSRRSERSEQHSRETRSHAHHRRVPPARPGSQGRVRRRCRCRPGFAERGKHEAASTLPSRRIPSDRVNNYECWESEDALASWRQIANAQFVTSRGGSRCTRRSRSHGSAAHPGSAVWRVLPRRRPEGRIPVRSLRHGSSGPRPPSPGP